MLECSRAADILTMHHFRGIIMPQVCDAVGHSHLFYNLMATMKTIVSQNLLFHVKLHLKHMQFEYETAD